MSKMMAPVRILGIPDPDAGETRRASPLLAARAFVPVGARLEVLEADDDGELERCVRDADAILVTVRGRDAVPAKLRRTLDAAGKPLAIVGGSLVLLEVDEVTVSSATTADHARARAVLRQLVDDIVTWSRKLRGAV